MRRAVLLAVVLLALAGCGGRSGRQASQAAVASTVTPSPATPATPAGAEGAYIAHLTASPMEQEAAYVTAHAANLVRFGHGICDDLRRGVSRTDEYNHVADQLAADPSFESDLGAGADAEQVRQGQAAIVGIDVVLSAAQFLCPDVPGV